MQRYFETLADARGNVQAGLSVLVKIGGQNATIYSDNGTTVQANPMTSDSSGGISFYAANGTYDLSLVAASGAVTALRSQIILFDPLDCEDGTPTSSSTVLGETGGVVKRFTVSDMFPLYSVKNSAFGATGDGTTDDTTAIQAALTACPTRGTVYFPEGTYVITTTLTVPADYVNIIGFAKILAKASTNFEYMLLATSRTGVTVRDLEFDANKANRTSGQNVRFMGAGFSGCTDCSFVNVTVRGARGYNGVSAVGLVAAGQSTRCKIHGCTLLDCGEAGNSPATDADGVFTSGTQNVISASQAYNCTDTGFVIESSNQSVITGCTTRLCGAGAGITSAASDDKYGNIIDGLTVHNWYGSVGGIQIGIPGAYAGNLLYSKVSNVTLVAELPTYGTPGPAILISGAGSGESQWLSLSNITIQGAATQGIVQTYGKGTHVDNAHISGVTDSCVQFTRGTDHMVTNSYLADGSYGVITQNTAECFVIGCVMRGNTTNGLYAFDTSTIYGKNNIITSPTGAAMAKDSGASFGYGDVPVTYSTSMTPDASLGDLFTITANNGVAFTINNASKPKIGQVVTLTIKNTSGGALGAITWGAAYYMSAWTSPATGYSRSISFKWNGSAFIEIGRTAADVPN